MLEDVIALQWIAHIPPFLERYFKEGEVS